MNLTRITSKKEKNMAKAATKIKIKAETITSMLKYQTMKGHMLILITIIMIQMIIINMAMTLQAILEMNIMLTNLKMIMIVIQMILAKMKKMLL